MSFCWNEFSIGAKVKLIPRLLWPRFRANETIPTRGQTVYPNTDAFVNFRLFNVPGFTKEANANERTSKYLLANGFYPYRSKAFIRIDCNHSVHRREASFKVTWNMTLSNWIACELKLNEIVRRTFGSTPSNFRPWEFNSSNGQLLLRKRNPLLDTTRRLTACEDGEKMMRYLSFILWGGYKWPPTR